MVHVQHVSTIAVPRDFAFDYVADFRNGGEWVFGVTKLEIVGQTQYGLGAVCDGSIKLGPTTLHSHTKIVRWQPPDIVALESVKGFVHRSTWAFSKAGDETTELVADISYELPGGLAGRALGKAIEPFVGIAVRHSDKALRQVLEQRYRDSLAEHVAVPRNSTQ